MYEMSLMSQGPNPELPERTERLPLGDFPFMLQEHGHLEKDAFVYQLRLCAQVRTAGACLHCL